MQQGNEVVEYSSSIFKLRGLPLIYQSTIKQSSAGGTSSKLKKKRDHQTMHTGPSKVLSLPRASYHFSQEIYKFTVRLLLQYDDIKN